MSDSTPTPSINGADPSPASPITPPAGAEPASQDPAQNGGAPWRPAPLRLKTLLAHYAFRVPIASDLLVRRRIRRQFELGRSSGFLPKQLALETVSHCNAACVMCPYPQMTRPKGIMSGEVHRQIVDSVAAWGAPISVISHAGLGEPLVDKRIAEKIVYEKSVFPAAEVAIFTNASLLTEKRARELVEAGLDRVSVSLNAFRKETYETVMKLKYEPTQENLHLFLRLRQEERWPITIHVSLIPTEHHSREEIEEFVSYWQARVDQVLVPPQITWGGFFPDLASGRQWPCRYIWEILQVDWDGTVKMCCEDYDTQYPLGNLREQPPDAIYNSPRLQQQRELQVRGAFDWPHICKNCVETHGIAKDFWKGAVLAAQANGRGGEGHGANGAGGMKVIAAGKLAAAKPDG